MAEGIVAPDKGKKVFIFLCITGALVGVIVLADRIFNNGQGVRSMPYNMGGARQVVLEEKAEVDIIDDDLIKAPRQQMNIEVVEEEPQVYPDDFYQQFGVGEWGGWGEMHNNANDLRD